MQKYGLRMVACVIIAAAVPSLFPKNGKDVLVAPLPAVIASAKKIFLYNGGGSNLAYEASYASMKEWGKYRIVGAPDAADLIVELGYKSNFRAWAGSTCRASPRLQRGQPTVHVLRIAGRRRSNLPCKAYLRASKPQLTTA
jgi:hypothetical protein